MIIVKGKHAQNDVSYDLSAWLTDAGSFMQRLKEHGVENAQVKVLKEGWALPDIEERLELALPQRSFAWVREVSIFSGNKIWMFARTVIPQATLTGRERTLQRLKNRSLGSILFRYPELVRSEFDYFCLGSAEATYKKISRYLPVVDDELWARRSRFEFNEKLLLLTEVFFSEVGRLSLQK